MEYLNAKIFGFLLVMTRMGAFFSTAPVFSWRAIPRQIKIAITVVLGLFFSALLPYSWPQENPSILYAALLMAQEAVYGLCLGLVAFLLFVVVRQAGRIVERQMGLNMASILDPFTNEQGQPLGMLLEILFILLLFSTNGHHILLNILSRSFDRFALGSPPGIVPLTESIVLASSYMFLLALKMAAPMLAAFLLLMVVLAFMARVAPETNVLFLSLPLRVGMGLLMVGLFIPYLNQYLNQFAAWLSKLLPV